MIDAESYPGAWQEAIDRGCLSETVARCKACQASDYQHPDPVFAGVIPLDHPTPPEAR